jgi:hypothetical protein
LPDRTAYKQYSPLLEFEDTWVSFEVPESEAVRRTDGSVIVTLDGFATFVLDPFASAIERMHDKWRKEQGLAEETEQLAKMRDPNPTYKKEMITCLCDSTSKSAVGPVGLRPWKSFRRQSRSHSTMTASPTKSTD